MPRSLPRFAALLLVCGLAAPAPAQFGFTPKAAILNPRVGFKPAAGTERGFGSGATPVCKSGLWAPVSVAVEFDQIKGYRGGILLEVTTADCDDMTTVSRFPLLDAIPDGLSEDEFLQKRGKGARVERSDEDVRGTAYVRLAGDGPVVKLRLVEAGNPDRAVSDSVTLDSLGVRRANKYVVLTLGANVPGLGFTPTPNADGTPGSPFRGGRVEVGRIDSVEEMPDQWFGYEAADLVVIGTGNASAEFVSKLFNSTAEQHLRKRRALFEWVRRGGKVVVSAGDKAADVAASLDFAAVLPMAVGPAAREEGLKLGEAKGVGGSSVRLDGELNFAPRKLTKEGQDQFLGVLGGLPAAGPKAVVFDRRVTALPEFLPLDRFPVAALKPPARGSAFTELLSEAGGKKRTLVGQATFGLGRVTVVAFDVDRSPFTEYANKAVFWEWLVANAGDGVSDKAPSAVQQPQPDQWNRRGGQNYQSGVNQQPSEDGIANALRTNVDHYDEVPVISFGWVALFILGYTLIIGPVEYILLKKLLGRLELTWLTFPVIVLSVSAAAYFTAYAVKGKDLRMNKVDVLDVDLKTDPARPRVYGRTWFTVFSPRIASYTVGVEPKDTWASGKDDKGYSPVTTVDWFGQPKMGGGGVGAGREYRYDLEPDGDTTPRANGLSGVPIQVWSTKAFTANWSGMADPANPPARSTLTAAVDRNGKWNVTGGEVTFGRTVNDVESAHAVYAGKVYKLEPTFAPDIPLRLRTGKGSFTEVDRPFPDESRFIPLNNEEQVNYGAFGPKKPDAPKVDGSPLQLGGLLFHGRGGVSNLQNASLRPLDQGWRMSETNKDEVILLFKLKRARGSAEALMTEPASASPSVVWLGGLPGRDAARTPLDKEAVLQQDAYLRLYLPVATK